MAPKLDPQIRNKILKVMKDGCSNYVINKAFKNQKRLFSNGLLSKLRKEIKFGWQSRTPGQKCGRKEVLDEKEKKAEKTYRYRNSFASKNFRTETTCITIENLT